MSHLLGANERDTLVTICTLLLIMPTAFRFSTAEPGLSPGLPRRIMHNSQSTVLNFNDTQRAARLQDFPSHIDRQLRVIGNFQGNSCSTKDISIFQGEEGTVDGISQFSVHISNNCMSCDPWDIHVYCGWFASARLVNYNKFKRINYNDCLVNGGRALRYGEPLTFTYANTRMYPMRLKSARFCGS